MTIDFLSEMTADETLVKGSDGRCYIMYFRLGPTAQELQSFLADGAIKELDEGPITLTNFYKKVEES